MTRPYSTDLRERVVRAVEAGASRRDVARRFEVSVSFVVKLIQRWRDRGSVASDRYGGWKASPLGAHAETIAGLVKAKPDLRIEDLRTILTAQGIAASRSALGRILLSLGLTRKKRRSMPPSRTGPTSPPQDGPGETASRN